MAPEKYWDRFDVSNVKHHTKRATFSLKKKKKHVLFCGSCKEENHMSVEMMTGFSVLIEPFL